MKSYDLNHRLLVAGERLGSLLQLLQELKKDFISLKRFERRNTSRDKKTRTRREKERESRRASKIKAEEKELEREEEK